MSGSPFWPNLNPVISFFLVALNDVLKAKKYSEITVNLFGKTPSQPLVGWTILFLYDCSSDILIENNRLNRASGVIKAYQTIMSSCRGEVPCVVTTAKVQHLPLYTAT